MQQTMNEITRNQTILNSHGIPNENGIVTDPDYTDEFIDLNDASIRDLLLWLGY